MGDIEAFKGTPGFAKGPALNRQGREEEGERQYRAVQIRAETERAMERQRECIHTVMQ